MTEPRDIEKDKKLLISIGSPTTWSLKALVYYITQYEAQQARIAELEKSLEKEKEITRAHVTTKIMMNNRLTELLAQEDEEEERIRFRMDTNGNLTRVVGDE